MKKYTTLILTGIIVLLAVPDFAGVARQILVKAGADPDSLFLTPLRGRTVAPLLATEEVTNATVILGTHDHLDHIDRPSWLGMAKGSPVAKFIVPKLVRDGVALLAVVVADGGILRIGRAIPAIAADMRIAHETGTQESYVFHNVSPFSGSHRDDVSIRG